ncbi:MAG: hypothetical protein NC918_02645 [Candidatus Omnitrophica bacterium]|nr:hypothetical protein [Candidatus Omnitrophota bacterium]
MNINICDVYKVIDIVKKEKNIKVKEIVKRTGFTSRYIRTIREEISNNPGIYDCIIGENSRDGYYICDTNEKFKQYIADMESRIISFAKQIRQVKEYYNERYAKEKYTQLELKI